MNQKGENGGCVLKTMNESERDGRRFSRVSPPTRFDRASRPGRPTRRPCHQSFVLTPRDAPQGAPKRPAGRMRPCDVTMWVNAAAPRCVNGGALLTCSIAALLFAARGPSRIHTLRKPLGKMGFWKLFFFFLETSKKNKEGYIMNFKHLVL